MVLFTDGDPGQYSWWFDEDEAAKTVNTAREMKDGGITIYTVGIFSGADPDDTHTNSNTFMNAVSSNYPEALAQNQIGDYVYNDWDNLQLRSPTKDGNYYLAASDSEELENVFTGIANEVTSETLQVNPDEEAVLSDTLSEYTIVEATNEHDYKKPAIGEDWTSLK